MDDYTVTYTTTSGNVDAGMFAGIMAFMGIVLLIALVVGIFALVCMWKVFKKAGKPGWAAIIPIYNIIVLLEIIGKPWWWVFGIFLGAIPVVGPFVALAFSIILSVELANKFGKSTAFGVVGLWLFSLVGYAILAFGPAQYNPNAAPVTTFLMGSEPVTGQPPVNQYQQPVAPVQEAAQAPVEQPVQPEQPVASVEPTEPQVPETAETPSEPNENQNTDSNV